MTRISLTRDLTADGFAPDELARLTRAGELVHLRRGAYAELTATPLKGAAAHRQLVRATVPQCNAGAVVSHVSAAVLHGLPVWNQQLTHVHLTRDRQGGGRTRRLVRVHGAALDRGDVVVLEGLRVTSLARTVVDLARTLPLHQAVAAGDAALALLDGQGLGREPIDRVLARQAGRTGIGRARRAVDLLDARSESAGESYSRVVFHLAGLPAPEPQYEVYGPDRRLVGRCDFGWPQLGVLGEFDGQKKYRDEKLRRAGQTPEDVVVDEKRREDALRALGWLVFRWVWAELDHPERLIAQLRLALERGRPVA